MKFIQLIIGLIIFVLGLFLMLKTTFSIIGLILFIIGIFIFLLSFQENIEEPKQSIEQENIKGDVEAENKIEVKDGK